MEERDLQSPRGGFINGDRPTMSWEWHRGARCLPPLRGRGSGCVAIRRWPMTGVGQGGMSVEAGNAARAKRPDLWHACEDGEVKMIGDEPANSDYDPGLSEISPREIQSRA